MPSQPSGRGAGTPPASPREPIDAAFAALYVEHRDAVVAGAHLVFGFEPLTEGAAAPLAEDAAERVFFRLWKNGGWWDIDDPGPYLHGAGRNEALDFLDRARDHVSLDHLDHPLTGRRTDPLDTVWDEELRRRLEAELDEFPEQCRRVCRFKWFEELSNREVANRLGVQPKAVEKQLARGRGKLRESGFERHLSSGEDGGG